MKAFKDKVREERGRLGLTQKELAEKAGIGFRTLVTYEAGERFPHPAQLYKLSLALGVTPEYLRDENAEEPQRDPARTEVLEEVRRTAGSREALDLEAMLRENRALFAGGEISEEAKDAYFRALAQAYLDCKEAARNTFGTSKE